MIVPAKLFEIHCFDSTNSLLAMKINLDFLVSLFHESQPRFRRCEAYNQKNCPVRGGGMT
jgi:hypothetical protein